MKEQIALMIEHGATPFWIAIYVGLLLIGFGVYCLEADNKVTRGVKKVVKYLLEDFIDIIK